MITKLPAVLEAVRNIPIAELSSSMPTFNTRPVLEGGPSSLSPELALQLDSYRLALVPFQAGGTGAIANTPRDGGLSQLLLLPLTWKEFVTKVRSELRHTRVTEETSVVQFGEVRVDLLSMEARRSNRPVSLTAMEFKVLKFFISNPYRVISRDELLNQVWGYDNYPCTRTVDNHVMRLRQKLEQEIAQPVHFRTVHGVGYKFIP
jgi:DNA-binding winged helix-turn-helix (wHTH) protein